MPRVWDKVLVVDFEATCWDDDPPDDQHSDIIEAGLCIWDSKSNHISEPVSYYIRPLRSDVSEYCRNLTGITRKQAYNGLDFAHFCNLLVTKWGSRNKTWAAFGDDASMMQDQCLDMKVAYPFGHSYLDVSGLYSLMHHERLGLAEAMIRLNMEFEGRPHSAGDDAYNTARVLRMLLTGVDTPNSSSLAAIG
jgi:inhibitor of KinA sporulation pathway (predicted exonuclease)